MVFSCVGCFKSDSFLELWLGSDEIEEEGSFLVSGGLSPLLARVVEPGQAVGIGMHLSLVLNRVDPRLAKGNIHGLSNELYTTFNSFSLWLY